MSITLEKIFCKYCLREVNSNDKSINYHKICIEEFNDYQNKIINERSFKSKFLYTHLKGHSYDGLSCYMTDHVTARYDFHNLLKYKQTLYIYYKREINEGILFCCKSCLLVYIRQNNYNRLPIMRTILYLSSDAYVKKSLEKIDSFINEFSNEYSLVINLRGDGRLVRFDNFFKMFYDRIFLRNSYLA